MRDEKVIRITSSRPNGEVLSNCELTISQAKSFLNQISEMGSGKPFTIPDGVTQEDDEIACEEFCDFTEMIHRMAYPKEK